MDRILSYQLGEENRTTILYDVHVAPSFLTYHCTDCSVLSNTKRSTAISVWGSRQLAKGYEINIHTILGVIWFTSLSKLWHSMNFIIPVDGATHLEKFITNLQRERSEVAFHIFTYGKQTLALNLSERFTITDDALEQMPWPTIITNPNSPNRVLKSNIFKSKLRFQIRHGDFRERISQVRMIINFYLGE